MTTAQPKDTAFKCAMTCPYRNIIDCYLTCKKYNKWLATRPHPAPPVLDERYTGTCAMQSKCSEYADFCESIIDELTENEDEDPPCPIKCDKRANPNQASIEAAARTATLAAQNRGVLVDLGITQGTLYEFCEWFCEHNCEESPCKITVGYLHERLEGIKKQMTEHPEYLVKWEKTRDEQKAILRQSAGADPK